MNKESVALFNYVCIIICKSIQEVTIEDVTTVYLQQTQGIGLSIHLNELLYYCMAQI